MRYDCQTCPAGPDAHLCEACHDAFRRGAVTHPAPHSPAAMSPLADVPQVFVPRAGVNRDRFAAWLTAAAPRRRTPDLPRRFVVRPEFRGGVDSYLGSYACVVQRGSPADACLLSALHVMDELIKAAGVDCSLHAASYTGEELPRCVDRVYLYDVTAPRWMLADVGVARAMFVMPDARLGEEEPYCQSDLVAFRIESGASLTPAPLALTPPRVGDPIWLVAPAGTWPDACAAVVVESTPRAMVFRYLPDQEVRRRSSGAPLVNERGEVVGITVGGGCLDGQRFGHAVHAGSIHRHLDRATA
jgi:hypothetical protein